MTTSSKYELHIKIPAKLIGPVVELLEGEGCIISMTAIAEPQLPASPAPKKFRFHNGLRNKGISARDLILQKLEEEKAIHQDKFGHIFAAYSFAKNSASPALSSLRKQNLIDRDAGGNWFLVRGATVA